MQQAIHTTIMRGGSSRALVFRGIDLPADTAEQDRIFLSTLACPDPNGRQVDGLGGTSSSTNKVAIVERSTDPDVDVDYTFGQLAMDRDFVDRAGNCGNISSAIGPFAVDEGLVEAVEPITTVSIRNTNTGRIIVSRVPVVDGHFHAEGEYEIAGVPGAGARIELDFVAPAGSVTGRLLPSGRAVDELAVPGVGAVPASLVDAANPVVFVRFEPLGLAPDVSPAAVDADAELLARIEAVRAAAAVAMGLTATAEEATRSLPSLPKLLIVGDAPDSGDADLTVLAMSMGRTHRALQLTGAVCAAAAATVPGTIVAAALPGMDLTSAGGGTLRLRHPTGVIDVHATVRREAGEQILERVSIGRTARRVMDGLVYASLPEGRTADVGAER